jgi:hypothetical protein
VNINIQECVVKTLLISSEIEMELGKVRLGKKIELRYIPFSELITPWNVCFDAEILNRDNKYVEEQSNIGNSISKILKNSDFKDLKCSIAKFGLLEPFEVAEIHERVDFFYGKGKFLVIDGKRRYLAIRELLKLPTEDEEKKQRNSLRTSCSYEHIVKGEMQAQKKFDCLSIKDYVLIPCLVYPYNTRLQMIRHSIEDRRLGQKRPKKELEFAERLSFEGINDLNSDDLRELCRIRCRIDDEKKSIEKTLQEIRNVLRKKTITEFKDETGDPSEKKGE